MLLHQGRALHMPQGPAAGALPSAEALDAHCLAQLARFKRPKRYEFVAELPKNNYGKVLKTALRERLIPSRVQ